MTQTDVNLSGYWGRGLLQGMAINSPASSLDGDPIGLHSSNGGNRVRTFITKD